MDPLDIKDESVEDIDETKENRVSSSEVSMESHMENECSEQKAKGIKVKKGTNACNQDIVVAHDKNSKPVCYKCSTVCKDTKNLKNHVLSHFYQEFYPHLPSAKPFLCPECGKESRDRITLTRHYAFAHQKIFELTEVTPDKLAGSRLSQSPRKPEATSSLEPESERVPHKQRSVDESDNANGEEDIGQRLPHANNVVNKEDLSEFAPAHTKEAANVLEHKKKEKSSINGDRNSVKEEVGHQNSNLN